MFERCPNLFPTDLKDLMLTHSKLLSSLSQSSPIPTKLKMEEGLDPEKQPMPASTERTETSSVTSTSRPTRGYAHLAEFMTKTRHGMMRRFKDLSTQNLLYLQAELYQLRFELDREAAADAQFSRTDERSNWDFHWNLLATSGQRGCDKRWKIWLKLRERLYEYREQYTHRNPQTHPECQSHSLWR